MSRSKPIIGLMPLRFIIMLASLLLMSTTVFAATTPNDTDLLTARGWQPIMILYQSQGSKHALNRMQNLMFLNRATLKNPKVDPEIKEISRKVVASLGDFKLGNIYKLLPGEDGTTHQLIVHNTPGKDSFSLKRDYPPIDPNQLTLMGESEGKFSMQPMTTANGYHINLLGYNNVGAVTWADIQDSLNAFLSNLAQPAPIQAPATAIKGINHWFPYASDSEVKVLSQLWTAFPASFNWLSQITRLKSFYVKSDSDADIKHVHLVLKLDTDAFHDQYPDAAAYVKKIRGFINGHITVKGVGNWVKATLDTDDMAIKTDFWIKNDHLVPTVNNRPTDTFPMGKLPDHFPFTTVMNVHVNSLGVRVDMNNLVANWQLSHEAKKTELTGLIYSKPEIKVSGWALGFVPTSLLHFLPINVHTTLEHFMKMFINSNNGKGAKLHGQLKQYNESSMLVQGHTSFDVANSYFVRLLMRMFNKRMVPTPDQSDGLRKMASTFMSAMDSDLKNWSGLLQQYPQLANVSAGGGLAKPLSTQDQTKEAAPAKKGKAAQTL